LSSCSGEHENAIVDKTENFTEFEAAPVSDTLVVSRTVSFTPGEAEILLANPFRILNVHDQYLILTERRSENFISVFSLPSVEYLYSFGELSRGPEFDQFLSIPMYFNVYQDELIAYDGISRRLRHLRIDDSTAVKTKEMDLFYAGQMEPLNRVRRMKDELYFVDYGTSFEETGHEHAALTPGMDEIQFTFGNYPETDLEGFSRYGMFIKSNQSKPDGSKFATFYYNYNTLKIYSADGNLEKSVRITDPFINYAIPSDRHEFSFRQATWSTNEYIYTLGYYTTDEEIETPDGSSRSYFEVWDWDGNPVYRASFDRFIKGFTVSETNQKIYAFSGKRENTIYVYDLPTTIE
jgi:hypothetical protein